MAVRWICALAGLALVTACDNGRLSQFDGQEIAPPPPLGQADRIKIVGSSTVAPFSTTVAEQFGAATRFSTPIVETTGTGGGFKAFCQAIGPNQPSISNASRRVKPSEVELCRAAGITDLVEVKIGFDGIVLANSKAGPPFDLTKVEIYRALAAELPDGEGGFEPNPNKRWSDVSPDLPDEEIKVYGPPPTSGTRDAFVEIAMEMGAEAIPELAALKESDEEAFVKKAHRLRTDGAWVDSGENDAAIIQNLIKNPSVLGVLGYSFLEQNADRVKASQINGVEATFQNIASGDYKISRSMYFYVKGQNEPLVPGLVPFIDEFTSPDAWGPEGYLAEKGLIPLPPDVREQVRKDALALVPMEPPAGT